MSTTTPPTLPSTVSLISASLIGVNYVSLGADDTVTLTLEGRGWYIPEPDVVSPLGFGGPITFAQDAANPLKFYATYSGPSEDGQPPAEIPSHGEREVWHATKTFTFPLPPDNAPGRRHGTADIVVSIYGKNLETGDGGEGDEPVEVWGEEEIKFNEMLPGFGSARGDAGGEPL